jgi:hypothetical protein
VENAAGWEGSFVAAGMSEDKFFNRSENRRRSIQKTE